jgi:hypothetical protein
MRSPQCHLDWNSAIGEENAREMCPCVREGQFTRTREYIRHLADRPSEFISNLHCMSLRAEFAWKHVTQLKLHCVAHTSKFSDPREASELPRVFRTGNLRLNLAASCPFRYSSMTSCGVL